MCRPIIKMISLSNIKLPSSSCLRTLLLFTLLLSTVSVPDQRSQVNSLKRIRRVIGGQDVTKGQWPWLAIVTGNIPNNYWNIWGWMIVWSYTQYICGGSVVNGQWILTAAHCVHNSNAPSLISDPKYWTAKMGETRASTSLLDDIENVAAHVFNIPKWDLWQEGVQKIIVHPQYNEQDDWKNDIALLKLTNSIPVDGSDQYVGAVTLAQSNDTNWPPVGTQCVMKGWGCTQAGGPVSPVAEAVVLPIVASSGCVNEYGDISNTRLCAGYNLANKGICQGDSGGPLECLKGNTWVEAGLASYTSASDPEGVPGVFTRISYYADWIKNVVNSN